MNRAFFAASSALLALIVVAAVACSKTPEEAAKAAVASVKFHPAEVKDGKLGGLVAFRYALPEGWKSEGHIDWNYSDLYTPMKAFSRAESPDGGAWLETFPAELFYWMDPRWDNFKQGPGGIGGIHQTNVGVKEAMQRYVIARYRGNVKNLKIIGSRPVGDLGKALRHPEINGDGIDFRLRYEVGSDVVDEEVFGLLTPKVTIPYHGPQGTTYEYHRTLALIHSIGAKNGKLEAMRPVLSFMAGTFETDKVWQEQEAGVLKQLADQYQRNLAAGYAQIAAAGALSRAISANNDAMISAMDAQRAAANAPRSSSSGGGRVYDASDDFDQYIRGTEHMTDSSGVVTDQTSAYNYHWTDGGSTVVHTNDPNYDPNNHSNTPYEKMTPVR